MHIPASDPTRSASFFSLLFAFLLCCEIGNLLSANGGEQ